jgi:iron(III) transport system substrate-binding protein
VTGINHEEFTGDASVADLEGGKVLRSMHRGAFGLLGAAVVTALLTAACGGDDDSSTGTTQPPAAAATTAAARPASGGSGSAPTSSAANTGSSGASATTAASSAAWDEVVAKAKEEGKVTIYSSQGLDVLNDLAAKFKDKYGITLEVVRGIDSDLIPKVEAEASTGNRVADVFAFANTQWGVDNAAKGMFVAVEGPSFDNPDYDKATLVSQNGTVFISTAAVFAYAWNTDRWSKGLTGYEGLLDPQLADGKIAVIDIHTSPVLVDFYMYLEAQEGPDFLTKLAAQKPKIYPSALPIAQALTSGEVAASVYNGVLVDEKAQGAPVDFGVPKTAWGARFGTVILKDSPHPNAAQVLADFMISPEGQAALARKSASVLPDTPGAVTSVDKVAPQDLTKLTPDVVSSYTAKWDGMFK